MESRTPPMRPERLRRAVDVTIRTSEALVLRSRRLMDQAGGLRRANERAMGRAVDVLLRADDERARREGR